MDNKEELGTITSSMLLAWLAKHLDETHKDKPVIVALDVGRDKPIFFDIVGIAEMLIANKDPDNRQVDDVIILACGYDLNELLKEVDK